MKVIVALLLFSSFTFSACKKEEKKNPRFKKDPKVTAKMLANKVAELIQENSTEPEYKGKNAKVILGGLINDGTIMKKMVKGIEATGKGIHLA